LKVLNLDLKGSTVISLLELEASVLAKINDEQFEGIKEIGLDPKHILWVNNGGSLTARNPDAEIVVGLGRTICSERGDQGFKTLSLEHPRDTSGSVDIISRVVLRMVSHPGSWGESEFSQKDGIVHIPRIDPHRRLNEAMATKTKHQEFKTYTIGQEIKPHFTATIGTPGLLDTLSYAEDPNGTVPLEKGDVEIEIKAGSLNFKDLMYAMPWAKFQAKVLALTVPVSSRGLLPEAASQSGIVSCGAALTVARLAASFDVLS
jgi:hypothetical protein